MPKLEMMWEMLLQQPMTGLIFAVPNDGSTTDEASTWIGADWWNYLWPGYCRRR